MEMVQGVVGFGGVHCHEPFDALSVGELGTTEPGMSNPLGDTELEFHKLTLHLVQLQIAGHLVLTLARRQGSSSIFIKTDYDYRLQSQLFYVPFILLISTSIILMR